jgi:Sec-independent protein translocase protein TatA
MGPDAEILAICAKLVGSGSTFRPLAGPVTACYVPFVFGFGPMEMALVALVVVLLFPPHEIPKMARTLARAYGAFRRTTDELRRAVMLDDELRKPLDEIRSAYDEARFDLRRAHDSLRAEVSAGAREIKKSVEQGADVAKGSMKTATTLGGPVPRIAPAPGAFSRESLVDDQATTTPAAVSADEVSAVAPSHTVSVFDEATAQEPAKL